MTNQNDQWLSTLKLLQSSRDGILSTHSQDVPGYPFGSVTPYALDQQNRPVILISSLAQHTKNIKINPKVCLTITEHSDESNKQSLARLSFIADAILVEDDEQTCERYLERFPESRAYFGTHDFAFYRLNPVRLRYIGGFGKIFWIEKELFKAH